MVVNVLYFTDDATQSTCGDFCSLHNDAVFGVTNKSRSYGIIRGDGKIGIFDGHDRKVLLILSIRTYFSNAQISTGQNLESNCAVGKTLLETSFTVVNFLDQPNKTLYSICDAFLGDKIQQLLNASDVALARESVAVGMCPQSQGSAIDS